MKNKWSNYALKDGKVKTSYIREYSNRKKVWKTGETGYRNCFQQSGEKQAEEEVKLVYQEPSQFRVKVDPIILNDAWVVNLRNKENKLYQKDKEGQNGKSETRIGSKIQGSGEERSEVGILKPRSRRRRSRNEEIWKSKDGKNGPSGKEKINSSESKDE